MSLNTAEAHVRAGVLTVKPPGPGGRERPFTGMAEAARYLAAAIWEDGEYWPGRSLSDPSTGFDKDAFEALVEAEVQALRAGKGWVIHATSGNHTVWAQPGIDVMTGELSNRVFASTEGELPGTEGGYPRVEPILRTKGIAPASLVLSEGIARDVRAVRVPGSAPAVWNGLYRQGEGWVAVARTDEPDAFQIPLQARMAARQALKRAAAEAEPAAPRL